MLSPMAQDSTEANFDGVLCSCFCILFAKFRTDLARDTLISHKDCSI